MEVQLEVLCRVVYGKYAHNPIMNGINSRNVDTRKVCLTELWYEMYDQMAHLDSSKQLFVMRTVFDALPFAINCYLRGTRKSAFTKRKAEIAAAIVN